MSIQDNTRSISTLLGSAFLQLAELVQNEMRLARAEISKKFTQATAGVAFLAVAAVVMIPALLMLLLGFALWLVQLGYSPIASHLAAAGAAALVSVLFLLVGLNRLKPEKLTPSVTIRELERDVATAKGLVK
jgi:hypothetical protein